MKCLLLLVLLAVIADAKHEYTKMSATGNISVVGKLEETAVEAGKGGLCDPNVTQYSGLHTLISNPNSNPKSTQDTIKLMKKERPMRTTFTGCSKAEMIRRTTLLSSGLPVDLDAVACWHSLPRMVLVIL